jgi:hypothetical protein
VSVVKQYLGGVGLQLSYTSREHGPCIKHATSLRVLTQVVVGV